MDKIVFSGVQPSGGLTIGNYIGAIKNWIELQDKYECFFSIVDMHAITVPQDPEKLRERTLDTLAIYLASGLDPEKSCIFIQSHVPAHAELSWILNSISYMGQLNRMTQFKEKTGKEEENSNSALFTYPVLMAADILLYQTDLVPVGDDQKQHLEFARDLVIRFNNRFGETFQLPEPIIQETGARIMSLQDPLKKMSKSDSDENGFIALLDDLKTVERKIKRSVTDSIGEINYSDEQPGIKNLLEIYSLFKGEEIDKIVKDYEGKGYGHLKTDLADIMVDFLEDFQVKYNKFRNDDILLKDIYTQGAKRASEKAEKTLDDVKNKIGFVMR